MKFNFKKISAIAISTLMTGMTMGVAAAASYPAPFVSGGVANAAVVYGTGTNVSDLDEQYAGNIQTDLQSLVTSTTTTLVEGGEAFVLEKTSNKFNFNDSLNGIYSKLDSDEMDFLADGSYDEGDIDEDYEQEIALGTKALVLFSDKDYKNKAPTVGFKFDNGDKVLDYTITFDNQLDVFEMVDTEMPILGKTYYVLAASATQIDLLDSADKVTISEGQTITLNEKEVTAETITSTYVKLIIDGESVDKLKSDGAYEELKDGSYVVLNENLYNTKESGISKAVISIGAGKMELISGEEVELNGEDIDGLESTIAGNITSVKLTWKSDGKTFLTAENALTMPGFSDLSLTLGGLEYADESEIVSLENGETFTIAMDNIDLPAIWFEDGKVYFGEEDYKLVVATSTIDNSTWTYPDLDLTNSSIGTDDMVSLQGGLELEEDNTFIVTKIDTDLGDVQTMYYQVKTIENNSGDILVELEDLLGDKDVTFDAIEDTDVDEITVALAAVNGSTSGARAYINFSSTETLAYNKVVSEKGLVVTIPTDALTKANTTGAVFTLQEANNDGDVGVGQIFNATVKNNSNDKLHVSTHNLTGYDEEESDDKYIGYVPSDLASKITFDESADEYEFSVEYFGEEVSADVSVVYGGSISTDVESGGVLMVKDSEVDNVKSKNLIIVGGSCINSAAANVLGFSEKTCGAAFTAGTGVGTGEYIIKSVKDVYTSGRIALVVAGYESADTVNAVQYLINKKPDTSKTWIGTTSTAAEEFVTEA